MNPYDFFTTHSITAGKYYKRLKENIAKNGILEPIKYTIHNGRKYIVDGHHRILAAKELILDAVPAEEVNLPYGSYQTSDDLVNGESRS